jgi:hypothetical protein
VKGRGRGNLCILGVFALCGNQYKCPNVNVLKVKKNEKKQRGRGVNIGDKR